MLTTLRFVSDVTPAKCAPTDVCAQLTVTCVHVEGVLGTPAAVVARADVKGVSGAGHEILDVP